MCFFLLACLSLAACKKKEEFESHTSVEYPERESYPYYKSTTFNPLYQQQKPYTYGEGYPYYKGMYENLPSQYEGQYPPFYPPSLDFPGYGKDLPYSPYFNVLPTFWKQWYMWKSKFFNPLYSASSSQNVPPKVPSSYPYNYPGSYPGSYPVNYPMNYPMNYPLNYPSNYPVKYPSNYPVKYPVNYPTAYPNVE